MKRIIKKMPFAHSAYLTLSFLRNNYRRYRSLSRLAVAPRSEGKRVVFNQVRTFSFFILFFETALAAKLNQLGANATVLIDDGVLEHYDTARSNVSANREHKLKNRRICKYFLRNNAMYTKYSELIAQRDLDDIRLVATSMIAQRDYEYSGIDLWPNIHSSLIRYFCAAPGLVEDEPNYDEMLQVFTQNALISYKAAQKIDAAMKPDVIVTSHGFYSTWGPFYEYFKRSGTKGVVYGFGPGPNRVRLSRKGLAQHDDGFFLAHKASISDENSRIKAQEIFENRVQGNATDLSRFSSIYRTDDRLVVDDILKTIGSRKAYALFPNLLWDASLTGADNIFASPTDWIIQTVKYFEGQPDRLLIVRVHPVESRIGVKVSAGDVVEGAMSIARRETIGQGIVLLNKNIVLISSDTPIKSYSLFPLIQAGTVYNGTIGLEMLYRGIPVLVAGIAPYSTGGFVYPLQNGEEYFSAFDEPGKVLEYQEEQRDSIMKYLYYYYELRGIPLTFFDDRQARCPRFELPPEVVLSDSNLEHIARTILGEREYFQECNLFACDK